MARTGKQPEIVRIPLQVQRAHDVLGVVLDSKELQEALFAEDPNRDAAIKSMTSSYDLLCWLLGHANDTFAQNMIKVEKALTALGYEMCDAGQLFWLGKDGDGPLPS